MKAQARDAYQQNSQKGTAKIPASLVDSQPGTFLFKCVWEWRCQGVKRMNVQQKGGYGLDSEKITTSGAVPELISFVSLYERRQV